MIRIKKYLIEGLEDYRAKNSILQNMIKLHNDIYDFITQNEQRINTDDRYLDWDIERLDHNEECDPGLYGKDDYDFWKERIKFY
jgi:hypothetical protein